MEQFKKTTDPYEQVGNNNTDGLLQDLKLKDVVYSGLRYQIRIIIKLTVMRKNCYKHTKVFM